MVLVDTTAFLESNDRFAVELESITETIIKPVVRRTLHTTLILDDTRQRNQDALELVGDIQVMLIAAVTAPTRTGAIRDLKGYAAKTAANACYLYLRTNFPERTRQENKLRYALKHMDRVSVWKSDDGRWLCGYLSRQEKAPVSIAPSIAETWASMETRDGYLAAVRCVLDRSDGPVLFDDLADLIVEKLGIREASSISILDDRNGERPELSHGTTEPATDEPEPIDQLKILWQELVHMQLRYRQVLLLNLKYKGSDLVKILPLCGIASIHEIAGVLEFTDIEFAEVLRSLPWADKKIADHLGVRRQQVINLRKYARSCLFRSLAR